MRQFSRQSHHRRARRAQRIGIVSGGGVAVAATSLALAGPAAAAIPAYGVAGATPPANPPGASTDPGSGDLGGAASLAHQSGQSPAGGASSPAALQLAQQYGEQSGVGEPVAADVGDGKEVTVTGDANLSQPGIQSSRTGNGLVSYTATVTNNGPAQHVTLSDVLPSTATGPRGRAVLAEFVSDTGNCTGEPRPYTPSHGQTVTCDLGTIASGDSASVTFEFALFSRSRARSPYAFTFTDAASASSDQGTSNSDSATLTYRMR
jgi:hypothetical protein